MIEACRQVRRKEKTDVQIGGEILYSRGPVTNGTSPEGYGHSQMKGSSTRKPVRVTRNRKTWIRISYREAEPEGYAVKPKGGGLGRRHFKNRLCPTPNSKTS